MKKRCLGAGLMFFLGALYIYPVSLSVRAGAGILWPTQDSFRELYGHTFPLALEATIRFSGRFGLAAGADWISKKGKALPLEQAEEEFRLRFQRISIPLTIFYELSGKLGGVPVDLAVGGGVSWNHYKETWETADLASQGQIWGGLAYVTADFRLLARFGLFASLRWESVPTGRDSPLGNRINLGGVGLRGGVSFRLGQNSSPG